MEYLHRINKFHEFGSQYTLNDTRRTFDINISITKEIV